MGFVGDRIDELAVEANADAQNGFGKGGKETVVVTASASQAVAVGGEGKSGDEDDVGGGGIGDRALCGIGFVNSKSTGLQLRRVGYRVEDQAFSIDAGQEDGFRMTPVEGVQIGFSGQCGEGGDDPCFLPAREGWDTRADAFRGGRCGGGRYPGELRSHEAA